MITPFVAGTLALGLNEGAYMAEIVRAGLISVDEGQAEAAQSLGMSRLQTLRRIVLPQAMRVIIPPTGNETISMLKTTSLLSVIAVTDLLYSVELIYAENYRIVPLLIVASLWYLIVTTVLSIGQYFLERRYGRGSSRNQRESGIRRLLRGLIPFRHAGAEGSGGERCARADGAVPMVKAEHVIKSFGRLEVLKGVSLEVQPGEVLCVLGPSGSGKSTFLRCINHLEKIDGGRLWVDGSLVGYRMSGSKLYELRDAEVCRERAEIGMVFQRFNLFAHMTVIENVIEAPIHVRKVPKREAHRRGTSCSSASGSPTSWPPTPASSRAASSSASPSRARWRWSPKLMLFDEPTSALDPELVGDVLG